jgi:hypothetical protein
MNSRKALARELECHIDFNVASHGPDLAHTVHVLQFRTINVAVDRFCNGAESVSAYLHSRDSEYFVPRDLGESEAGIKLS